MIQTTPQMRILVAIDAEDFRKGIDGLARVCRDVLESDPFGGWVFVFRNRRQTALRLLCYDGQGFWLAHKRFSKGRFRCGRRFSCDRDGRLRRVSGADSRLTPDGPHPA